MAHHQRSGVVDQHLLRHAPEVSSAATSVATNRCTRTGSSATGTRSSPKSICRCRPGGVSNRSVAFDSAASSRRYGVTARSTVRRFGFISQRYERRSLVVTTNLPFARWSEVFLDPTATAAVIDRIVHHATVLQTLGHSYRLQAAKRNHTRASRRREYADRVESGSSTRPAERAT